MLISLTIGCNNSAFKKKLAEKDKEELKAMLTKIYVDDQKCRENVSAYIARYGIKSTQVKELGKQIGKADSINMVKVKKIIDEHGWLGKDVVGEQGNSALFLVVQHGTKNDRKYFLPLMRMAVKSNLASAKDLAFLEDRVAEEWGGKQIYGTQMGFDEKKNKYFLLPIENPQQVDERRAKVGLPPLSVQLSQWQIETN